MGSSNATGSVPPVPAAVHGLITLPDPDLDGLKIIAGQAAPPLVVRRDGVDVRPAGSQDRAPGFVDDVAVIGGCGRAGLPLGLALAQSGLSVVLYDTDPSAVEQVAAGRLPFLEPGAADLLAEEVRAGLLRATTDAAAVRGAEHVVVVIGTPVDEHLNPHPDALPEALEACRPFLVDGQLLILRSTVYPGVTALVERMLGTWGRRIDVAFCPERIAEGRAMAELSELPQLIGARTGRAGDRATALFARLTHLTVTLQPEEAELAKLFTNAWRYMKFAIANQFFMIANDFGCDFEVIRHAVRHEYPRAADLPGAGFAAGPCLFKDTMQLAAFADNNFVLGHAAMLTNEGLPMYLVSRLEQRFDLANLTVGILGMAFKGDSDDIRASLAYKLRRLLKFKAAGVLCSDPFVDDPGRLVSQEQLLDQADVLVIGAPHSVYRSLSTDKPVLDVWNVRGNGVLM